MATNRNSSRKPVSSNNGKNGSRRAPVRKPAAAVRARVGGSNGRGAKVPAGRARVAGSNGRGPKVGPRTLSIVSQREQLEQERREVQTELERLRTELQETPEATGDEVDLSVYDREKTLGLIGRYQWRLDEIERALRATQKGAYGICERCHQPIDPARLQIFPEATMCVKCKNEKEQLARRGII